MEDNKTKNSNSLATIMGANISSAMKERGLNQTKLRDILNDKYHYNLSIGSMSHYMTGKRSIPHDLLCTMADVLNISMDYIYGKDSEQASGKSEAYTKSDTVRSLIEASRHYYTEVSGYESRPFTAVDDNAPIFITKHDSDQENEYVDRVKAERTGSIQITFYDNDLAALGKEWHSILEMIENAHGKVTTDNLQSIYDAWTDKQLSLHNNAPDEEPIPEVTVKKQEYLRLINTGRSPADVKYIDFMKLCE